MMKPEINEHPSGPARWVNDPWRNAPFRWWGGRGWTTQLARVGDAPPPKRTERWVWLLAIGVPVFFVACALAMMFSQSGWFRDPWTAKVVSVEGPEVCTETVAGDDGGFVQPLCFDEGIPTSDGRRLSVDVGTCVELDVSHPEIYANRVVRCP